MTDDDLPGGALIELFERHGDDRKPLTGTEALIVPNELRINGRPVYAAFDAPVVMHELTVDGSARSPFTVTVTLQCRSLTVGDAEPVYDLPHSASRIRPATIRFPADGPVGVGEFTGPYVVVNDEKLWLAGPAVVAELTNAGDGDHRLLQVTLPLLCRRLVVDDEPNVPRGSAPRTVRLVDALTT